MSLKRFRSGLLMLLVLLAGCDDAVAPTKPEEPPTRVAPVDTANPPITAAELRRRLGASEQAAFRDDAGQIVEAHLAGSGVTDLVALKGLPLRVLDVRGLPVADLSPLEGMPLQEFYAEETGARDLKPLGGLPLKKLYLSHTGVSDLAPLAGMELDELNLVGTRVRDLEPLSKVRVGTLWLRSTSTYDLSPLSNLELVSLDVERTPVSDLRPLADMTSLRRLNIARTAVTDLAPLAGLRLERLVFTPSQIQSGLDIMRDMPSLTKLGTRFEDDSDIFSAEEFWKKLDAGELR
jgi:hypothetical protein